MFKIMKMKTLFVAALATMFLVACNKDAEPTGTPAGNGGGKTNFAVSLPGAPDTYAVEDPQAAGAITPFYDNITVYLVDAGDNLVGYAWTNDEIAAREKRFEQIVEPVKVYMFVNTGSVTMPTGSIPFASLEAAYFAVSAADQNRAVKTLAAIDLKGNAAGSYNSVQQVMLVGEQDTFTTETSTDGHTLKKATIELQAMVSRFEFGTVGGVK